jgi:uncharacterized peroxidase-related enzyme
MSRFSLPSPTEAPVQSQPILNDIAKRLGFVPNLSRLLSISPAVLTAVVGFQKSLNESLDAATRIAIAMAVSEVNGCSYCLSSHCYIASNHHSIATEEVERNRHRESDDPKRQAATQFAAAVVEGRGHVSDEDLKSVREAGFSDAQILVIIALSVQYLMTNLMNNVARTEIDVELSQA